MIHDLHSALVALQIDRDKDYLILFDPEQVDVKKLCQSEFPGLEDGKGDIAFVAYSPNGKGFPVLQLTLEEARRWIAEREGEFK